MQNYDLFVRLHAGPEPLLIGNVWDTASAVALQAAGCRAVATSSRAIAHTMGCQDGENIPFIWLLETVQRIQRALDIPLSVDLETGYAVRVEGVIRHMEKLYALGVVGVNLEDSDLREPGRMRPPAVFARKIERIMNHLSRHSMPMFLNARTDAYLHHHANPLEETLDRIKAYESAGASGIFVPFLSQPGDIRRIAEATALPLNVFATPELPSFAQLASLGVRRISTGATLHRKQMNALEESFRACVASGSFDPLYGKPAG